MPLLHIIPVSVFLVELFGDLCPVVVVVDDCCSSVVGVCVSSVEEISQNVKYSYFVLIPFANFSHIRET